jgi:hypothetical protein
MITTTKHALIFLLTISLLVLVLSALPWQGPETEWQRYQRAYFESTGTVDQIAVRQVIPRLGPDGQPTDNAPPELCLTCHIGLQEISASHPVETYGCVICHGGIGLALDTDRAHDMLLPNPSDLSLAAQACGQAGCHGGQSDPTRDHLAQVTRSLQATYAGGIALIRYTFGTQEDLNPLFGIVGGVDPAPLPKTAPSLTAYHVDRDAPLAEAQFAQNCLTEGCHLTEAPSNKPYRYRATGCATCHVLYSDEGLYTGDDPTILRDEPGHPATHQFTIAIPFGQCNHCHNRGNYSLRTMSFTLRPDLPPSSDPISLSMPDEGRRLLEYYQPIGQFTLCEWELDCIDCHTQTEAMGDGHFWPDQKTMQYVQCRTCHGTLTDPPDAVEITDRDDPALRRTRLNGNYELNVGDLVILTERGEKLGNVQLQDGQWVQYRKVNGEQYVVPLVMGSGCQQQPDEQESRYCHQCHSYQR